MNDINEKGKPLMIIDLLETDRNTLIVGRSAFAKEFSCEVCGAYLGTSLKLYSTHMKESHGINIMLLGAEKERSINYYGNYFTQSQENRYR